MFVRDGKVETRLSLFGPLAAGVPGMLAACDQAVAKYGNLSLKRHLLAAAEIASLSGLTAETFDTLRADLDESLQSMLPSFDEKFAKPSPPK